MKVSQEFSNDVISAAVESGIGYWAHTTKYRWRDGPTWAEIVEYDESDPNWEGKRARLDLALIQTAINRLVAGGVEINHEVLGAILASAIDGDTADIDAPTADVIVQIGVFGKIVYG